MLGEQGFPQQENGHSVYLEALVAVEVGPLELLDPLLHDLLRQQRHRHLHEHEVPRAIKHQPATNAEREED
jgi:hypothetical protein